MNIKEAFRYQNFIDRLMDSASAYLGNQDNTTDRVLTHRRKAANPDAEDMTEPASHEEAYAPCDVLALIDTLIAEKTRLSMAISKAKSAAPVMDGDIRLEHDAAMDTVRTIRAAASSINRMLQAKKPVKATRGTDYKFNAEGNQTAYYYNIETEVTDRFDRTAVKASLRRMLSRADHISAAIETAEVNVPVAYDPPYDVNDTFADIMERIAAEQNT